MFPSGGNSDNIFLPCSDYIMKHSIVAITVIIILLFSCRTVHQYPNDELTSSQEIQIEIAANFLPLSDGVKQTDDRNLAPEINYQRYNNPLFPLIYHVIKVDLSSSDITLITSPLGNTTPLKAESTATFAKRTGSIVAINATPYKYTDKNGKTVTLANRSKGRFFDKGYRTTSGIFISENGSVFSPTASRYSAALFSKATDGTYRGRTLISQATSYETPLGSICLGGFFTIVNEGEVYGSYADNYDSRNALGFCNDGKTMFILVVEGERKSASLGLDYKSCAEILITLGADNALQLDGGGSTALCIEGKNALSYSSNLKNANNLGVLIK